MSISTNAGRNEPTFLSNKKNRITPAQPKLFKESFLQFGSIYLVLALINLRVKLFITSTWHNGILERNHDLLLHYSYTNNEQSRLFQFYIPEFLKQVFYLSTPDAYIIQRWVFTFLTFCCFHYYLRKWFDKGNAFSGVLFLAAIMPLTYFNHLQESAPLLLFTFLLVLWAIREQHMLAYSSVLCMGAINNETMLFLPAIYWFYNFKNFKIKALSYLALKTVGYALPAYFAVGAIRYINRDRPHLGGAWHLPDNINGILNGLYAFPLDYWKTVYLYIFFIFGVFWIFSYLKFNKKPLFLQRSVLAIPLFIIPHLVTGIILEVRQMLPLGFIIIPAAFFYLFMSDNTRKLQ